MPLTALYWCNSLMCNKALSYCYRKTLICRLKTKLGSCSPSLCIKLIAMGEQGGEERNMLDLAIVITVHPPVSSDTLLLFSNTSHCTSPPQILGEALIKL